MSICTYLWLDIARFGVSTNLMKKKSKDIHTNHKLPYQRNEKEKCITNVHTKYMSNKAV